MLYIIKQFANILDLVGLHAKYKTRAIYIGKWFFFRSRCNYCGLGLMFAVTKFTRVLGHGLLRAFTAVLLRARAVRYYRTGQLPVAAYTVSI